LAPLGSRCVWVNTRFWPDSPPLSLPPHSSFCLILSFLYSQLPSSLQIPPRMPAFFRANQYPHLSLYGFPVFGGYPPVATDGRFFLNGLDAVTTPPDYLLCFKIAVPLLMCMVFFHCAPHGPPPCQDLRSPKFLFDGRMYFSTFLGGPFSSFTTGNFSATSK